MRRLVHPHHFKNTRCGLMDLEEIDLESPQFFFFLFDLILYVHSTIFQLCGTGLPGLNQY